MLRKIREIFDFEHATKKISIKQLTEKALDEFNKDIPKEFLSDGIVIRPNDKKFSFENIDKPKF